MADQQQPYDDDEEFLPFLDNNEYEKITNDDSNNNSTSSVAVSSSSSGGGTATKGQVAVNVFISFVGSGMLGMPYAISRAGWLLGIVCIGTISWMNVYAMLLLVKARAKLESTLHVSLAGYGDVGRVIFGSRSRWGERFVNVCLVISQLGFATAYIIFIAANIIQIYPTILYGRFTICMACVPMLCLLIQIKDMKHLSPFSLLADVANITGLIAVLCQDYQQLLPTADTSTGSVKWWDASGGIYVSSVALYSLEGVGMVLPLESSCVDRSWFPKLLKQTLFGITTLMCTFGVAGYMAFGNDTLAPITLNLPNNNTNQENSIIPSASTLVKLALCLGLYLTYPIMLFPVNSVMEDSILSPPATTGKSNSSTCSNWKSVVFRCFVVIGSSLVAWLIPDFGNFLSLIGASICTILGFILPAYFHYQAFDNGNDLTYMERYMDYFLFTFGIVFGVIGTYQSFTHIFF